MVLAREGFNLQEQSQVIPVLFLCLYFSHRDAWAIILFVPLLFLLTICQRRVKWENEFCSALDIRKDNADVFSVSLFLFYWGVFSALVLSAVCQKI